MSASDHETRSFENRTENLLGRPRVAGAGEHDELARPLARHQRLPHRLDRRGVRLSCVAKRGVHADIDDVEVTRRAHRRHRREPAFLRGRVADRSTATSSM